MSKDNVVRQYICGKIIKVELVFLYAKYKTNCRQSKFSNQKEGLLCLFGVPKLCYNLSLKVYDRLSNRNC